MSHYEMVCMHGLVVSQCRCPSDSKVVHVASCPDTPEHDRLVAELGRGDLDVAVTNSAAEVAEQHSRELE